MAATAAATDAGRTKRVLECRMNRVVDGLAGATGEGPFNSRPTWSSGPRAGSGAARPAQHVPTPCSMPTNVTTAPNAETTMRVALIGGSPTSAGSRLRGLRRRT
jgi:hypothetical protein